MKPLGTKNYLLAVLMVILAFNYVDRLALGLLLQDIKTDLDLSDTQLGFLSGIAFALFYSFMGIPIARWADRGNRVWIIAFTTALWSATVALCGVVASFPQLLLVRVGVAVGEAGCIPPAHSLIADYFNRAERPRAVARYMLGASFSGLIGYFLAGWLNELYGWRATFIVLGLPGVLLAPIALWTLKEPRVEGTVDQSERSLPASAEAQPALREVVSTLWANTSFRHLLFCFAVAFFFGQGIAQWQAAFFVRVHGLQTGQLGTWFAVIYGLGTLVGTYLGGEWASRRAERNERLQLVAMAIAYACFGVISMGVYLTHNLYVAFGLMAFAAIGGATANGPLFATIQTLVPERMRAVSIALIYLVANLTGMGLGPLATGALSDALRGPFGDESLKYALIVLCPGYLWAAWHAWKASRTVREDLEAAQQVSSARSVPPFQLHHDHG